MAQAKCGMMWSWDSPMWCSGKKDDKNFCLDCPWYKGNNKSWYEENASHGAFALTQEEIDYYYNPEMYKTPIW